MRPTLICPCCYTSVKMDQAKVTENGNQLACACGFAATMFQWLLLDKLSRLGSKLEEISRKLGRTP